MSSNPLVIEPCAESLVWDAHAGIFPDPGVDLNLLNDWRNNGVNYVSINIGFDVMNWQQTLKTLAAYRRWILDNSTRFTLIGTVKEIEAAKNTGKLAVSFDIEGMNALNNDINMISLYQALGVRQMLFAYNLSNEAAGGCHDNDSGLTAFGKQIVAEMNRVGLIVDCSHAAYQTTIDIMDTSDKPVVFSHSNPTRVWEHQRNIRDKQIKACAATGGVIGINGMGIFLGDNVVDNTTLLRHITYLADLVGPEHVGLGFDYSPGVDVDISEILKSRPDYWPAGQGYDTANIKHAGPHQLADLSHQLRQQGFNDEEICGVFGENFKRVASACWGE